MMRPLLEDRHAVVTGGARGIGAAVSSRLLVAGCKVTVLGKSESHYNSFFRSQSQYEKQLSFLKCDLGNEAQVNRACEKLAIASVDILINNAGINKIALAEEVELSDWDLIQMVNVKAPFMLSKAVLPFMASQKWGRIVNVASIFGEITKSKRVSYTSSKAALIGMTKAIAVDYAAQNILVNCVSPGFLDTDLTRSILSADEILKLAQEIPMKRLGQASEITEIILHLCSDLNTLMTGQNLILDGGFSIV